MLSELEEAVADLMDDEETPVKVIIEQDDELRRPNRKVRKIESEDEEIKNEAFAQATAKSD